ncbi:tetratricopeptide repeat protein [Candidatus Woesearchaeota archaeon]|nr:tetratricopeptide repeat protein [Candidatus Woesearchaeota archaeon]
MTSHNGALVNKPSKNKPSKYSFTISVLVIILLSVISYFNIFQNEFVWDDHIFILENPDIRSFSNIPVFFKEDVDGLYRPLRTLHYTFIYSIAGKNEFLYHFNSIFFHTAISILVFFIIFEMIKKKWIALTSALIFAAHPIHTERVANITAGFDLLGIFFMLFSFYIYMKFSESGERGYFFASLILFIFALLSSEEAITLPLLIILYEFCFTKEKTSEQKSNPLKNILKDYTPFFAIIIFYLFLRFFALQIFGRSQEYLAGNFYLTMLTMLEVYAYYIYLLFIPLKLTLFYDIKAAGTILGLKVLLAGLLLLLILFSAIKFRKNKVLFFSVFWFFITLIPMSNMLPLQIFMAERYLYVPSISFSLLASYFLFKVYNFAKEKKKRILAYSIIVFVILILAFYSSRAIMRNKEWKNDLVLWSKTVETNPNNSRAHDNLGFTYEKIGKINEAKMEFEKAVELQPNNFRALANLGAIYAKLGQYNASIKILKKSIEINPYHKTYDKLGLVYLDLKMEEDAIKQFNAAININPRYAKAHNDLAAAYARIGKFDLAMGEFKEAIRLDKDYAEAHYNLGILFEFMKQNEEAKKEFEIAAGLEKKELYIKKLE